MNAPSNIDLKHTLVGDYARNQKRVGLEPDMGAIESQVLADLAMVDQYESEQASKPAPVRVAKERDIHTNELDAELEKNNMRAYVKDVADDEQPGDMILDATPKSEKAIRMFGRVKQILRPRGDIAAEARKGKDLRDCTSECTDPVLALEFLELWTWYGPLRRLPSPKNKFFMMTNTDAAMAFVRGLEDICDRSTGRFGPWWVK